MWDSEYEQETEPLLGASKSVNDASKPATLANGVVIRVPHHIAQGDTIRVCIENDEPVYEAIVTRAT